MTTDPDPNFPVYKMEVMCGNGVGRPSPPAPADLVNSSGIRTQSISIFGESAPNIGSDSSSEDDGNVKQAQVSNGELGQELQARIDAMEHEKMRLTAEYEVEVQQCADLRDALEERERALADAQAPIDAQLQEAHIILEAIQREEDATQMRVEDEIGHGVRILEAQDRAIATLELQLHEQRRGYEALRSGTLPMQDTDIEAALKAADREMSELLAGVQRREETISYLNSDLRHAIEYMIAANVEAAGGPRPDLSREDFLPARVREHLGLSQWGETHLSILFKKYELIMSEMKETPFQPDAIVRSSGAVNTLAGDMHAMPHPIPKTSARGGAGGRAQGLQGSRWHSGPAQFAPAANQPRMWSPPEAHQAPAFPDASDGGRRSWDGSPKGEEDTLVAAGPEEGDSDVWAAASEDGDTDAVPPLPVGAAATESTAEAAKFGGPCSVSFAEESGMLREAMAQELLQLADTLAPAADSKNVYSSEPACELMRAAAQGDEAAVRHWLPRGAAGGNTSEEAFLGWTVWHVAAAYGQCGVLDLLKEDTFQKGGHHFAVLNRRTRMGLPPLGVACVTGRVEAARSLIMGMAPVDVRDVRGNTPLLWAAVGGQPRALVPLLLDARADAEASNYSGQQPDIAPFLGSSPSACNVAKTQVQKSHATDAPTEKLGEAFHLVRAASSQAATLPEPGLMSMAVGLLRTPSRDVVGFSRATKAWQSAQLSSEERIAGFWSEWVTNYTHAGLLAALEVGNPGTDPTATHRSHQALVLTSERLLFFHAKSWSLTQVLALSELSELSISSFSASVVILRMHRLPDIVLDTAATSARSRLLDELQRATSAVAATWGGADFCDSLAVRHSTDPIVELYDERRNCIGTLAYVEADIFLLLPYAPNSMLLQDGDTFFFGLLDLHQDNTGAQLGQAWRWQSCFAMVKSSSGHGRRLVWCLHPNDEQCVGSVQLACIQAVQPLDTPRGEHCFVLDCRADGDRPACALTFRAGSAQSREDWVVSVRTVQQAVVG
mmetsp:Transcript_69919/g.138435  ORF Transcript_69919/g.138435 Transcript_69919/m.138435 type:complete len:1008 (-) Transcript_69919:204-3227(-)